MSFIYIPFSSPSLLPAHTQELKIFLLRAATTCTSPNSFLMTRGVIWKPPGDRKALPYQLEMVPQESYQSIRKMNTSQVWSLFILLLLRCIMTLYHYFLSPYRPYAYHISAWTVYVISLYQPIFQPILSYPFLSYPTKSTRCHCYVDTFLVFNIMSKGFFSPSLRLQSHAFSQTSSIH